MSKFKIVCSKCVRTFTGNSDYDAEIEFNNHECIENGRILHDLTEDELIQIIKGEKTEEEIRKEKTIKKGSV
jgi:hypothetical protein